MATQFDPAALVAAHQAEVWRYLRYLGCTPAEADDLTQETFLAIIEKPFDVVDRAATAAYLRTVARNLFLGSRRRRPVEANADADAAWERQAAGGRWADYLEALRGCVEGLDAPERQALDLRYAQGAPRERLAEHLGVGEEGAKSFLRRIKERLKLCIEGKLAHE